MHEQKFKDTLSSTYLRSSERRVLILESEAHKRPVLYPHWGYHFITRIFCFHVVKHLIPILTLLPISSSLWKPRASKNWSRGKARDPGGFPSEQILTGMGGGS